MSVQNFVVKALRESVVSNYRIMQETGISDQTIANYRDGKTAPKGVNLQILAKYLGIANYSNDAPVIRKIPFYDDLATNTVTDRRVSKKSRQPVDYIVPGDWFPEATAALRYHGDSMKEYPNGSILVLKEVTNPQIIYWGNIYVIETEQGRITKKLQNGDSESVVAYSTNNDIYPDGRLMYEPITIQKESIARLFLVIGFLVRHSITMTFV